MVLQTEGAPWAVSDAAWHGQQTSHDIAEIDSFEKRERSPIGAVETLDVKINDVVGGNGVEAWVVLDAEHKHWTLDDNLKDNANAADLSFSV